MQRTFTSNCSPEPFVDGRNIPPNPFEAIQPATARELGRKVLYRHIARRRTTAAPAIAITTTLDGSGTAAASEGILLKMNCW